MICPGCNQEIGVVFRGLVVIDYVPHPMRNGKLQIDEGAKGYKSFWEEYNDGAEGVFYKHTCGEPIDHLIDLPQV